VIWKWFLCDDINQSIMIIISLDRELFYPLKQACTSCEIARLAKNPQNRSRGEKSPKKLKNQAI